MKISNFLKELLLNNFSIATGGSNLSYPAGIYRNEFWLNNNETAIKITTFILNYSKDKSEI